MSFDLNKRPNVKLGIEIEDYCLAAKNLACSVADIRAIDEIESAGSGFLTRSKIPKILFEGQVFYRIIKKNHGVAMAQKAAAIDGTICYAKWTHAHYIGREGEYVRLEKAIEICKRLGLPERYALMAASWGRFQILADNYKMVGFDSPEAMVEAMFLDEDNHLEAFCKFIIAARIADDLRNHNWDVVARVYNGPGYAKQGYHIKLPRAWRKFNAMKVDCAAVLKGHVVDVMPGEREANPSVVGFDNTRLDDRYTDSATTSTQSPSHADNTSQNEGDTVADNFNNDVDGGRVWMGDAARAEVDGPVVAGDSFAKEPAAEGTEGKQEPPAPPPVEVKAATPSLVSRIMSIGSMLTAAGVGVGSFVQSKLEQITLNHVLIILGFIAVGYAIYHFSSKRAQERTKLYINNALNPNTPDLTVK